MNDNLVSNTIVYEDSIDLVILVEQTFVGCYRLL